MTHLSASIYVRGVPSPDGEIPTMPPPVCPHWVGYSLIVPWRKWFQNPGNILGKHVREGMTVLEVGPGMGFFTLPMARMVGREGKVVCVDVQESMLRTLTKRAEKAGLASRIVTRVCEPASLCVGDCAGTVDFALLFAVVHEVPDAGALFRDVAAALKSGGRCLVSEPRGHVTRDVFGEMLAAAAAVGLFAIATPKIAWSYSALLERWAG